ncbi:MAG TPA: hypothetical protein VG406_18410 [Isosphaeraceae bacterium]|jgi:hypothetical protein|nr:hypothetical protein [Isosphaeraceae bacterium]
MARKRPEVGGGAAKVKVNLSLDAPTARRLAAFAGFHGLEMSAVVARALERELKGFVVSQRGTGDAGDVAEAPRLAAAG